MKHWTCSEEGIEGPDRSRKVRKIFRTRSAETEPCNHCLNLCQVLPTRSNPSMTSCGPTNPDSFSWSNHLPSLRLQFIGSNRALYRLVNRSTIIWLIDEYFLSAIMLHCVTSLVLWKYNSDVLFRLIFFNNYIFLFRENGKKHIFLRKSAEIKIIYFF